MLDAISGETMKPYAYTVHGSGTNGQTWVIEGTVVCDFAQVWSNAIRESFEKLTQGQAVFGRPGVGCTGPFDIHEVLIKQVKQ